MEKENYETYEYEPASGSNNEAEPYQFFVVQDDGTFLINRQVQYVTQVQEKEVLEPGQPCAMLDVAPQQFYVDIDTSAGMISVPEQFNGPEGSSNLYASSYLLQPASDAPAEEQIDDNVVDQLKANLQDDSPLPVASNSFTEVTLTDDQYHMLEKKGWILLETNDKVYVLDTLGLHDITTNDKLIRKLKVEESATDLQPEISQLKIEYPSTLAEIDVEIPNEVPLESKVVTPLEECTTPSLVVDENKEAAVDLKHNWDERKITVTTDTTLDDNLYEGDCDKWKDDNILRVRTDFCLRDIPNKIVLGRTINGKRLVCKVVKPDKKVVKHHVKTKAAPKPAAVSNSIPTGLADVGDEKLDGIFRACFSAGPAGWAGCGVHTQPTQAGAAGAVAARLLRLPAVRPHLLDRNILVTKVVVNEQDSGITESPPVLVTGKVMSLDKEWVFVHKPDLYEIAKQELSQVQNEDSDHNFLHMHIHEIQRDGNIVRTAVTLNKRRLEVLGQQHSEKIFIPDLPLEMISKVDTENTMFGYACGTCAAIFQTERELGSHRETHTTETDDKVAADKQESNFNKNGIIILSDSSKKTKTFACMQCNARFQRLNNCQRHVRTHMAPVTSAPDDKRVYDCKICYSSFHHAPTLLKHIMKNHIKVDK